MLLQAADTDLGRETAAARRHLALALGTARENLTEARALVAALAPAELESAALDGALGRLTRAIGTELGIIAELRHDRGSRAAASPRRGGAAPGRPGSPGQRAQARPGPAGAGHAAVHQRSGDAGGHRRRLRFPDRAGRGRIRPARHADPGRRRGRPLRRPERPRSGHHGARRAATGGGRARAGPGDHRAVPRAPRMPCGCWWRTTMRWYGPGCWPCSRRNRASRSSRRRPRASRPWRWPPSSGRTWC